MQYSTKVQQAPGFFNRNFFYYFIIFCCDGLLLLLWIFTRQKNMSANFRFKGL
jgi:hypothetical protein